MNEVIALVKFNSGVALALKEKVNFKYNRHGNLLIGIDDTGTFVNCLRYEEPWGRFKAFAGREFDIPLENGEVIHCNGQWWAGGSKTAEEILKDTLVHATYEDIDSLKRCYVYTGCHAVKGKLEKLIETYKGKTYEYYEFEKELKEAK